MPETSTWATVALALLGLLLRLFKRKTKATVIPVVSEEKLFTEEQGPVGIVFIDDSETDLTLIRKTVNKLGLRYRVKFIRTGTEALSFLVDKNQPWATAYVRLIVLDILMPDVAGLELLQAIRSHESLGHVPVVVFTGSLARYKIADIREAGADSCVLKTGDFAIFEKRIMDICHYWLTVNQYEEIE